MKRIFTWIDDNLIAVLAGFLLVFLPLYPKWPLFDVLPGYIVRVRLEDFLISGLLCLWLIWTIRKKVVFEWNLVAKLLLIYLGIGLLSVVSAVWITKTIPLEAIHLGKSLLHWLRRAEYFSLFFIFYTTIKSYRQVKTYLLMILITALLVTIYGFGQKYLYWPAFSTMNREFSKGWWLYLTEHARVLSTFGGHYDLAAYLVMILTLLWGLFLTISKKIWQLIIFVVTAGAFWLLILTASRTSFIAYLVAVSVMCGVMAITKGVLWSAKRLFGIIILSLIIMFSFGDMSERFTKLLKIDKRIEGIKVLLWRPAVKPPTGQAFFLENNIAAVTSKSDMPPTPLRPSDVYEDIPLKYVATMSGGVATMTAVGRTYSQNAMLYDLSTAIRLDALWPRAIAGFKANPLLGTGYATLTKIKVNDWTEAESTDNDYLRALGETGGLGFLFFFGAIGAILIAAIKYFRYSRDETIKGFLAVAVGATIGLLVNAMYIDVFEASKVAFYFWALVGILFGAIKLIKKEKPLVSDVNLGLNNFIARVKIIVKSEYFLLSIILFLALTVRLYKIDRPIGDWHSWRQADTSAVSRNFLNYGIDWLRPKFDDLSSVPSGKPNPEGYRFVEFPVYNVVQVTVNRLAQDWNLEKSGRIASVLFSLGSLMFLYLLVKKYLGLGTAYLTAFLFAVLPYNLFYSTVILPEPALIFFSLGMLYFWTREQWVKSIILGALAMLIKPTTIFLFLPMVAVAMGGMGALRDMREVKETGKKLIKAGVFLGLMCLPFLAWRWWMQQYPEGIPANMWLLNGDNIRFKGAFFQWLVGDRLGRLILTAPGMFLFLLGVVRKPEKEGWFFHWWLIGMLLYLIVFATGNVRHDYYQAILVPILVIFMAKGIVFLWQTKENFHQTLSRMTAVICLLLTIGLGWYAARDFYNINHQEIVSAGEAVAELTPQKSLVIAPYQGDTAFLYQTRRRGWPLMEGTIEEMIKKGAHYYVSVLPQDNLTQEIRQKLGKPPYYFKIIKEFPQFIIVQLVEDKFLPKRE